MGLSGKRVAKAPESLGAEGEQDAFLVRTVSDRMIAFVEHGYHETLTQTVQLYKWILASLITINGGAIVALSNVADRIPTAALGEAGGWFAAGCITAVLAGLAGALSANFTSGPMMESLLFWVDASATGKFDADKNESNARKLTKRGWVTTGTAVAIGLASLACFGLGAQNVAQHLSNQALPSAER